MVCGRVGLQHAQRTFYVEGHVPTVGRASGQAVWGLAAHHARDEMAIPSAPCGANARARSPESCAKWRHWGGEQRRYVLGLRGTTACWDLWLAYPRAPGTPHPEDKERSDRKAAVEVLRSHTFGAATLFRAERAAAHTQTTGTHACTAGVDHI